jgi:hypothetical protein
LTGVLFSMWLTFASGYQVVYQGLAVILTGMVGYAFLNARRQRLGKSVEPTERALAELIVDPAHVDAARPAREVA